MHGTENTGDVRSLTDAELDNVGGGHPLLVIIPAATLGFLIGAFWKTDFDAQVPSWFNTMI